MAIRDFNSDARSAPRATDPRRTQRAPFPARAQHAGDSKHEHGGSPQRLTGTDRDEPAGERLLAADRRVVARCPACGKAVLAGEDYVRSRGELYHARCVSYHGDGDGPSR